MRVTKRDIEFLKDLYYVKYVNSKRVGQLFGNYQSAMRRLRAMQSSGYIRVVDLLSTGERVYSLTRKGSDMLLMPYQSTSKTDKINHALACCDFYFYLKSAGHSTNYFSTEEVILFQYKGKKHRFRPDIIIQIDDRWHFVEIDLTNRRIIEKVRKWEMYYKSMRFKQRFSLFPPIIFATTNIEKIKGEVDQCKLIDLNYAYIDMEDVMDHEYKYTTLW